MDNLIRLDQEEYSLFSEASALFSSGDYEAASQKYMALAQSPGAAPIACFKLAEISNITGDPLAAKELYYKTLALKPDLCSNIFGKEHPNHNYIFQGKKDVTRQEECPLCGGAGEARWCYFTLNLDAHARDYNPVVVWMYCDNCNHLYAEEFPEQRIVSSSANDGYMSNHTVARTDVRLFRYYSEIISRISAFAEGDELLEVGLGGCECALTASEMAYNVFGLDIFEGNALQARKYGIGAQACDFMQFEPGRRWDVIILGDVIEHVSDPVRAIEKVYNLLNDNGAIWISTPNFQAAFPTVKGHNDPMRWEPSHKNYFSRESLFRLLERFDFIPVDYRVSGHYNGSMEVIAVKKGYGG